MEKPLEMGSWIGLKLLFIFKSRGPLLYYATDLEDFVIFVDRFLDSQKESWIRKLKLTIGDPSDGTKTYLSSWIDAVTKRRIQQLDVSSELFVVEIPLSIYTCETLVQLRLYRISLLNADFVSLPCLKNMHLICVKYKNESTIEKIISGSPVLEDLIISEISGGNENVIRVRSQMLKRIRIGRCTKVEIDAPLLQFLKTEIFGGKNYKIISSGFPNKVDINGSCKDPVISRDILTDISKARDIVISGDMWKDIILCSEYEQLLEFRHLSRLTTTFSPSNLEMLPTLLQNCPNLESLILEIFPSWSHRKEKEPSVMFSTVPRCLVSSLKFVRLKRLDGYPKSEGELELVRYFLKHSTVLEKLWLHNYHREKGKCDILKELLAMPRCSSTCEVLIL